MNGMNEWEEGIKSVSGGLFIRLVDLILDLNLDYSRRAGIPAR